MIGPTLVRLRQLDLMGTGHLVTGPVVQVREPPLGQKAVSSGLQMVARRSLMGWIGHRQLKKRPRVPKLGV